MYILDRSTIARAHEDIIREIFWDHIPFKTENKEICWLGKPVTITITDPERTRIHPRSPHRQRCYIYEDQLINGRIVTDSKMEFVYDYHDRLFDSPIDQIDYICEKLAYAPVSRRAIAITWRPDIDTNHDDVPCLQFVQCAVSDDLLDMWVLYRSEDMLGGFGPNAFGLTGLQRKIADDLDLRVGRYEHIVTMPHLYPRRDLPDIAKMLMEKSFEGDPDPTHLAPVWRKRIESQLDAKWRWQDIREEK